MITLASIAIDLNADTSRFDAGMNGVISRAMGVGGRAGSAFGIGFSNPILNALAGVNSLIGGVQTVVSGALDISGMRTAATFGVYRRQLTAIAGDAGVAEKAIKGFVDIANNSSYDTDQVLAFGLKQAGKTGDVAGATAQTQRTLDAAAALGVTNGNFNRFQINLDQMQNRGGRVAGAENIRQFRDVAGSANTIIAKSLGISVAEANKKIFKSTGNEIIAMINAVGDANKGAAARMSGSDPLAVGANIIDSMKSGMEPTGRMLNTVLTPVALGVKKVVDTLGLLNSVTGGGAGLVGVIGGGVVVLRLFGGATATAIGATRTLTGSLLQMAGAAEIAAGASRAGAISSVGGGLAGVAGGAVSGTVGGGIAAVAAGASRIGGFIAAAGRVARFIPVPVSPKGVENSGNALRMIGLGGFVEWVDKIKGKGAGGPAADKHAKAMQEHTAALQTASKSFGGGARTATSLSIVEREWSVYQIYSGNKVGVG